MVNAGVNNYVLSRSGLTFEGIQGTGHRSERALYAPGTAAGADVGEQVEVRYFQDPQGRLPLSPVDTDARWRSSRLGKPTGLHYQENVIVDDGGFILCRPVTHASEGEWKAAPALLETLPVRTVSLAADTACSVGQLRELLRKRASRPTFPSIRTRRPTWCPRAISSTGATI